MIGINGLGRIGRLAVRRFAATRPHLIRALNDPADLDTLVHLLRHDSIHGQPGLAIAGDRRDGQDYLVIGGRPIPLFHEADPGSLPFAAQGVTVVVESSGRFTRRADAARHLRDGVAHVVISAPSPDPDLTVIAPLNGAELDLDRHRVISNASCTAHATAPMLAVLEKAFGIDQAGMSTVHVVTNDQRILDLPHKDHRRARAAFRSIIPTTSSAFGALHQALPWLPHSPKGVEDWGFSGAALRVPTLSVNLVDLTATLKRDVTVESVNAAFREASEGWLKDIVSLAPEHTVSSDLTGRPESVLMDLDLTRVLGGRFVKVFGWHDNETGYAARLCELVVSILETTDARG
ncbi:MAG TPA: glyceraldehyde 3-phosphate dehydrogenase NAD-binding domain-containing protein [Holophagaceae bacterium]|nr:glyceraldehyde 3-phosphate dehydrogenase NAD-binding domain-containing protein [Holophagaceae bacterium]